MDAELNAMLAPPPLSVGKASAPSLPAGAERHPGARTGQRAAGPLPKTVFLARSLEYGGAQRQLVTLVRGLHERGHPVVVVLFYAGGVLEEELLRAGVPVRVAGKGGRWDVAGFLRRLLRLLREERPQILHSYLDLPNLVALGLRPLLPQPRLVWGIRASEAELRRYDWLIRLSTRLVYRLARRVDLVIVNSEAGGEHYRAHGVPAAKLRVIPNGIDTDRFAPAPEERRRVRAEWGIEEEEVLIGLVARLDPMKDHPTFLRAAARLARSHPRARFVCVGDGPAPLREALQALSRELELEERLLWSPMRPDVPAVYNALDLLCSSSAFGEGFSNAIGEAMACGVPCVVTDVGDAAHIVGESGVVVPPRDPAALAAALTSMLAAAADSRLQAAARERIVTRFGVATLLDETEAALWARV